MTSGWADRLRPIVRTTEPRAGARGLAGLWRFVPSRRALRRRLSLLALILLATLAPGAAVGEARTLADLRATWLRATVELAQRETLAGRLDRAAELTAAANAVLEGAELSAPDAAHLALAQAEITYYHTFLVGPPYDDAVAALRAALGAAELAGDAALLASARDALALALFSRDARASDHAEARALLSTALAQRRDHGDFRGVAESLFHLGLTHEHRENPGAGDIDRAKELYLESLAIAREHDHAYEASFAERHLAGIADERGDLAAARVGFERSLALRRMAGATLVLAPALTALADVLVRQGEPEVARTLLEEALAVAQRIGSPRFATAAEQGLMDLAGR